VLFRSPVGSGCDGFDFDLDADVDLNDYEDFMLLTTGPSIP